MKTKEKDYKLIEKRGDDVSRVTYTVQFDRGEINPTIHLGVTPPRDDRQMSFFAIGIEENNRGWTIETWWLNSVKMKIFLARGMFEKIYL